MGRRWGGASPQARFLTEGTEVPRRARNDRGLLGGWDLVTSKRAISPETALRLGRFFGNEPEFWLAMQASYDLAMVRGTVGAKIETEVEIAA